jgi:hypothetical protein
MPYDFQEPDTDDLIVLNFYGDVTLEELGAAIRELRFRAQRSGQTRQLVDFRKMSDLQADFRQILFMASRCRSTGPSHPHHAMLVESDLQYGMARMLEQVHDSVSGAPSLVTRSVREAYAWLGLTRAEPCA